MLTALAAEDSARASSLGADRYCKVSGNPTIRRAAHELIGRLGGACRDSAETPSEVQSPDANVDNNEDYTLPLTGCTTRRKRCLCLPLPRRGSDGCGNRPSGACRRRPPPTG